MTLGKRGVTVIPDVLANAGGVAVSYFEWLQNKHHEVWTESQVKNQLQPLMENAFASTWDRAKKNRVSLRTAAFVLGLQRLADGNQPNSPLVLL